MADIALVHLALDATAVKTGADQSAKALKSVDAAMDSAAKHATDANAKITAANQKIADSSKKTADAMGKVTESSHKMGGALNTLGGPVGTVSAQLGILGNAIDTAQAFIGKFGLIGGVAATAAAGVTALSTALVKLTLDGVGASDQIGDIAEETGFSILTITKLAAAYRLSGEDIGSLTRAIKTFTGAVVDARDPASAAAVALKRIGTDSVTAGRDIETAFIKGALQVKELRQTVEGAEASNLLFSKGIGALVRQQDNLNAIFGQSEEALRDSYIIPTKEGIEAGGRLDAQINKLTNTWIVFTQNLAATSVGAAMEASLGRGITALASILNLLQQIERNPYAKIIVGGVALSLGGAFVGAPSSVAGGGGGAGRGPKELPIDPKVQAAWDAAERKRLAALSGLGGKPAAAAKAEKPVQLAATDADIAKANSQAKIFYETQLKIAETSYAFGLSSFTAYTNKQIEIEEAFRGAQLQNAQNTALLLTEQLAKLKPGTANYEKVNEALDKVKEAMAQFAKEVNISVLPAIDKLLEKFKDFALPLPAAPPLEPPPGFIPPIELPHPEDIEGGFTRPRRVKERTAEQEALDQQFAAIFDGFLITVLTAQKSVGEAFKDFGLSILDTMAAELTKSFREAFITPLIKNLTDMLTKGLEDLFGGLGGGAGGKGLSGVFGGVFKGIGKIFGGIFGGGGTLGPGKFGIAGERGPELIFSGSQPMHIAPVTAGSAGNVFNISIPVSAPNGTVDKRTQDQIAATVLQAVKRAQRNEGAR